MIQGLNTQGRGRQLDTGDRTEELRYKQNFELEQKHRKILTDRLLTLPVSETLDVSLQSQVFGLVSFKCYWLLTFVKEQSFEPWFVTRLCI